MEFPAPENSAKPEFPAPLLHVAPQHSVRDLAEFLRARNYGISAKLEFPAPLLHIAPQHSVRDLAEFRRAENYGISGPRKFCPEAEIPALG
jgi:hypothetical protein